MNASTFVGDFCTVKADLRDAGRLFYLYNVAETSYEIVEEVPNFYRNAWRSFALFILLENVVLYWRNKAVSRLNDSITSLSLGLIQECGRLLFRGSETAAYIYIYNKWRLVDLPWNSPWTWYTALLAVDFFYYWVHRASHEIHIFWAQHQVHHSSEEFNITVGLRQSVLQGWCSFLWAGMATISALNTRTLIWMLFQIFYLPMAFFIPPSHFMAHQQFNLLFQVWIHTKTIKTLGPLEYLFNTPRHHRVHHGCNLYCLDKNYGGVFIVWDRLFGTFAQERDDEEIVYGLVFNQPSFNPLLLQVFYNEHVVNKFNSMRGLKNKIYSLFKGPSWRPGSPWTGYENEKPDIKQREIYDVKIPFLYNLYISIHFVAVLFGFQYLSMLYMEKNALIGLIIIAYVIFSLTTIGLILENNPKAPSLEICKCLLFLLCTFHYEDFAGNVTLSRAVQLFFCTSVLFWSLQYLNVGKSGEMKELSHKK